MADTLPVDTGSAAVAARMSAKDAATLSGLLEHDRSGWIPDAHDDDCPGGTCTGCDPQWLAKQQQAVDCETLRAARERSHSESDRIAYALDMVLITHPGCCTPKNAGGQS